MRYLNYYIQGGGGIEGSLEQWMAHMAQQQARIQELLDAGYDVEILHDAIIATKRPTPPMPLSMRIDVKFDDSWNTKLEGETNGTQESSKEGDAPRSTEESN